VSRQDEPAARQGSARDAKAPAATGRQRLVLGIETATRRGSVGLVASSPGEHDAIARAEVSREAGQLHGALLLDLIDACLARAGESLERVDAIAVSIGPGSFTGLRVGLATAKGLALAGAVALIGVSTLEALAEVAFAGFAASARTGGAGDEPLLICPCLDARRGQVYGALFSMSVGREGPSALIREAAWSPDALGREILDRSRDLGEGRKTAGDTGRGLRRVLLIGEGAERYPAQIADPLGDRAVLLPADRFPPSGVAVARLGAAELDRRGADDLAGLVPRYARASDAELARAASEAGPTPSADGSEAR
jgi:tRNA threonylcarbamoyladenosine biosynthesis protein TsaB